MVTLRVHVVTAFGVAARNAHPRRKAAPGALLISKSKYEFKLEIG